MIGDVKNRLVRTVANNCNILLVIVPRIEYINPLYTNRSLESILVWPIFYKIYKLYLFWLLNELLILMLSDILLLVSCRRILVLTQLIIVTSSCILWKSKINKEKEMA